MEICTMFLVWKKQYGQNDNITQSNLQITLIPIKFPVSLSTELEHFFLTICMGTQKTLGNQKKFDKEKGRWRNQTS